MHILTPAEEFLYFHHAAKNPNLHVVARLILMQGRHPEEAMSIRKEDVDLHRRTSRIPKGKTKAARRTIELMPDSMSILRGGESPWIFPSPKRPGRPITKLNGVHDRLCEKHKLNFVIYDLRHSFATRYAEHTQDLASVAAILGHNSIRIVMKYVHPTQATQRAGMNKFYAAQAEISVDAKRKFEADLQNACPK